MAPIGSYESHSSPDFTTDDLRKIVSICKEHAIKNYLTVNTVIYGAPRNLLRAKSLPIVIWQAIRSSGYRHRLLPEIPLNTNLKITTDRGRAYILELQNGNIS